MLLPLQYSFPCAAACKDRWHLLQTCTQLAWAKSAGLQHDAALLPHAVPHPPLACAVLWQACCHLQCIQNPAHLRTSNAGVAERAPQQHVVAAVPHSCDSPICMLVTSPGCTGHLRLMRDAHHENAAQFKIVPDCPDSLCQCACAKRTIRAAGPLAPNLL